MPALTTDKFSKLGNGTQPLPAQLSVQKLAGATTASLAAATGWDTSTKKHIRMYQTTVSGTQTVPNQSTLSYYTATLTGTTLSNLTLVWSATGSDQTYPAGSTVDLAMTSSWVDDFYAGILANHDQLGNHKDLTASNSKTVLGLTDGSSTVNNLRITSAVTGASPTISAEGSDSNVGLTLTPKGTSGVEITKRFDAWTTGLPTPNTITYNGNGSYDCVYNSTDLTGYISPGMRLRTSRTVTAPTGAISLNGTTQYASRTTPSGITFTNNFTCSAWVKPTAYGSIQVIVSRLDGASTNGWRFELSATGAVSIVGISGGVNRSFSSYQSVPLNKWTHVAASFDMATPSCLTYINGILVPSYSVGGAGTSITQSGNLVVGAVASGSLPFTGKIAQVAVYSAIISAANIRATISQTLSGSETSLVSAFKLDQASGLNDLTANANNLTATGSPTYATESPFTTDANGTPGGTNDYAIVQKASFSTNTTLTVQVPEGCAIPTSGGVSAVAYSSVAKPYGMPADKSKYNVTNYYKVDFTQNNPTPGTWYNLTTVSGTAGGLKINAPIGTWQPKYTCAGLVSNTSNQPNMTVTLSTSSSSETDREMSSSGQGGYIIAGGYLVAELYRQKPDTITITAATDYYLNMKTDTSTCLNINIRGATEHSFQIIFENAFF